MGNNPTDRGTLGTTRRVLTDGPGLPLGIAVAGAHCHEMQWGDATLAAIIIKRPEPTVTHPPPRC